VKMETVAHVKGREAAEAGNAQGLIALPAGLRGCAPTVTLDGAQGQLLISVAAFATDFLDDVGAHLHKKTKHAYITTIPISPYLAWATFCSSNKILIDSTEAVQSFLGPHWHCKTFGKGSTARSIKPLHLTWLPAKQQLHIKFNCAIYNGQGMLQTDGRKHLWEGPYCHWPPSPPPPPPVEQVEAASLSETKQPAQNPIASRSTTNVLVYALLNVDMGSLFISIVRTLHRLYICQLWPVTPQPIEAVAQVVDVVADLRL